MSRARSITSPRALGLIVLLGACQDDAACLGLDECIAICGGNVSCEQDCYDTNAVGAPLYVDYGARCPWWMRRNSSDRELSSL